MQALEKKIAKGWTIEQACKQLSLDVESVRDWIAAKKEFQDFEDFADGVWGRESAKEAIVTLKKVIDEAPDPEIRRRAAKDLLEFYRDERKRLETKKVEASKKASLTVQADLWDLGDSPWNFPSED